MADVVGAYLRSIQKELATGKATEHTYRPALKALVESLQKGVSATNEPMREACGAPDLIVKEAKSRSATLNARTLAFRSMTSRNRPNYSGTCLRCRTRY